MKLNITRNKSVAAAMIGTMLLGQTIFASDYDTHWAKDAIDTWSTYAIVKGQSEGVFAPSSPVTRAELATFLSRLFTYELSEMPRTYTDLAADAWYTDAITRVTSQGIMYTPGTAFKPSQHATREEVAYAMAKAYGLESDATKKIEYTDSKEISGWAADAVQALAQQGYIKGNPDGSFKPQSPITRAEVVTMIDNLTANYIHQAGTYETVEPGNVVINASDVTLKNVKVEGNLYITDAADGGKVTLENVEVTGKVYIQGGKVTLSGTYNQVQVDSKEAVDFTKGRIKELSVVQEGATIRLRGGTVTDHLILTVKANIKAEGTVNKTTSTEKAAMYVTEAGVFIGGEFIPVAVDGTTITIDLQELLDKAPYGDVMEGLAIYTNVEEAYLQGYAGGKLLTNYQYSFRQADYELGMIEEMLRQVKDSSAAIANIADSFGVTADTVFFMLSDDGEISIRHMLSQYNSVSQLIKQTTGVQIEDEYEFKRKLCYKDEQPVVMTIRLVIK